ncbi:MAG: hypothetical protein ACLT29_03515 [Ruminococcus callidus]
MMPKAMVEYDRSAEMGSSTMLSSAANSSGVTVTFPTETVRFFPGAAEVVVSVDVVTDVVSVVCVVVWSTIWIERAGSNAAGSAVRTVPAAGCACQHIGIIGIPGSRTLRQLEGGQPISPPGTSSPVRLETE